MLSFNLNTFFALLLGAALYYGSALFGISIFSFHPSNITLLWLPFGIGVLFVHQFGVKALPLIFLGSFFANYPGMSNESPYHILHTTIAAIADTLAPYLSARLIKRYANNYFDNIKILFPFAFYGAIIPTFISSLIIALNLASGGYIRYFDLYGFVLMLMFADSLGLLLLYPLYESYKTLSRPTSKECTSAFLYTLFALMLIWSSFYFHYLIFLVLPLLLISAFHIRMHLLMGILLIVVIGIIALSANNPKSIFDVGTQMESILMLITYLISLVFVIIGTSLHHAELVININLTNTDNLTKVKNVKAYKERINELISNFERYKIPFSMMIFDIDDFKMINDTHGHRTGDIVLMELTALVQKNVRHTDTLFRVGGEEFVILCPNTSLHDAIDVANKIKNVVEHELTVIPNQRITISIGVSQVKEEDAEDTLYRRVDGLLYESKQNGKNKITFSH